jgi:hypothetical protein
MISLIGTDNSEDSFDGDEKVRHFPLREHQEGDKPVCYMCFDEEDSETNPMITPCKCSGDTKFVHVECLRKWHTAEADNQICFLSSVDATCSVCKSTFKSDFKLRDGRHVKLFKSSLEPPYISLLVATKHEMAQRLFNTRFQLSFKTIMKPDGRNATRPLLLGRSSGSDMVLDYRTVSARHAAIRFKNGEFIFTDAGSSNGSYLYLRRPLELNPSQTVQFRLGRSMIAMKVSNKWNRRLLRAVRRTSNTVNADDEDAAPDDRSIGSTEGDILVSDVSMETRTLHRRTRETVMQSLPPYGQLNQQSSKHLDLLYALAYPQRTVMLKDGSIPRSSGHESFLPISGNSTTGNLNAQHRSPVNSDQQRGQNVGENANERNEAETTGNTVDEVHAAGGSNPDAVAEFISSGSTASAVPEELTSPVS